VRVPVITGAAVEVAGGANDREQRHARLDQPPRQQQTLAAQMLAVTIEPVVIPATMGLDKGVWYRIRQGIRGLLAHDEGGRPRVYVICEPSSHYYQIMTRDSRWMATLIGERI
jgi:hypothetical protein